MLCIVCVCVTCIDQCDILCCSVGIVFSKGKEKIYIYNDKYIYIFRYALKHDKFIVLLKTANYDIMFCFTSLYFLYNCFYFVSVGYSTKLNLILLFA